MTDQRDAEAIEHLARLMHRDDCEHGEACEHATDPWYRQLAKIALDHVGAALREAHRDVNYWQGNAEEFASRLAAAEDALREAQQRIEAALALAKNALRDRAAEAPVYDEDPLLELAKRAIYASDATVLADDVVVALGPVVAAGATEPEPKHTLPKRCARCLRPLPHSDAESRVCPGPSPFDGPRDA